MGTQTGQAATPNLARPRPSPTINLVPPDLKHTQDILNACDKALEACKKANEDKKVEIKTHEEKESLQAARITKLEGERDGILNNKFLWMVVGAAITGLLIHFSQPAR